MSGPESLRGFDYQISYTLLHVLRVFVQEGGLPREFAVEDLDDEGADLILRFEERPSLRVQIKKLAEGYQWTPRRLACVIHKFCAIRGDSDFLFVSNGQGNRNVARLKNVLLEGGEIPEDVLDVLSSGQCSQRRLSEVLTHLHIWTRCYPSDDDADPARGIRAEIERVLTQGRFQLRRNYAVVLTCLWRSLFEMARTGTPVSATEMQSRFEECGLSLASAAWATYPTAERFYPQSVQVTDLKTIIDGGGVVLITGIGGTGKTTLAAEVALRTCREDRPACWVSVTKLLQPEDLVSAIALQMEDLGLKLGSRKLKTTPRMDLPSELARQIDANCLRVFIDRIDGGDDRMTCFLAQIIEACPATLAGVVVLTSRLVSPWWDEVERTRDDLSIVHLSGLPTESAVGLLLEADLGLSRSECEELAELVDNHPQSLHMLCQLDAVVDTNAIAAQGVASTRDWLLTKVIAELPAEQRTALEALSIFEYPISMSEAELVIGHEGPLVLRALVRRDLVRLDRGTVATHDALRAVAVSLLSSAERTSLHANAARRLLDEMKADHEREDFVLYEKSIKWASHLEELDEVSQFGGRIALILSSQPDQLRDLFAIHNFGFPFEFEDPSLGRTWEVIRLLESQGLIEPCFDDRRQHAGKKLFKLKRFEFFDCLLIDSLCLRHGYSGCRGYVPITQFNHAFRIQQFWCPWEHCIELFPLPKVRTPGSCPIFGHDCPGGEGQAVSCRDAGDCAWDYDIPE